MGILWTQEAISLLHSGAMPLSVEAAQATAGKLVDDFREAFEEVESETRPKLRWWGGSSAEQGKPAVFVDLPVVGWHAHEAVTNVLVSGRKRWLLYPSNRSSIIQWERHKHQPKLYYTTDAFFEDIYPRVVDTENAPHECEQEVGDIIFVPELWPHLTMQLKAPTMGIAVFMLREGAVQMSA